MKRDSNFRVASVDGFGERDDLALERDRAYENRPPQGYTRWEDYEADEKARKNADSYGTSSKAKPISKIIEEMLENECYQKLLNKSEITWDLELAEALTEACIQLGLSDEEFAPSIHDLGFEIDLRLI